jgi:hypothetical protein
MHRSQTSLYPLVDCAVTILTPRPGAPLRYLHPGQSPEQLSIQRWHQRHGLEFMSFRHARAGQRDPTLTRRVRSYRRSGEPAWRDPSVSGRQQGKQDRGIIVEAVQRHPRDPAILCMGPLSQQSRLAVTRGRSDGDHAAIARATRLDEFGATYRTSARLRNRQLGIDQQLFELGNRRLAASRGSTVTVES